MKKSTKYGIISSVVSCILVLLLLIYVVFPTLPALIEDEGIIVSFGNSIEGSGKTEVPANNPQQTEPITKPVKAQPQELLTQKDNSLALAEKKRKELEKKEKTALENKRIEEQNKLAEKKRKEQEAIENANVLDGKFGNNDASGSGISTGETKQGNPVGKGYSGGNSWSLNGRSLTGKLVSPTYNRDVEGIVTVNIRVDAKGKVTNATIGSPTTISDAEIRNAAANAAKNTSFSPGNGVSTGSITYKFNLK